MRCCEQPEGPVLSITAKSKMTHRNVSVEVGGGFSVVLHQTAGTPYAWRLGKMPPLLRCEPPVFESVSNKPHLSGGPQTVRWDFTSLGEGMAEVEFHFKHFCPDKPIERIVIVSVNSCASSEKHLSNVLISELAKTKAPLGQCTLLQVYRDHPQCIEVLYRNPDMAAVYNFAKNFKMCIR